MLGVNRIWLETGWLNIRIMQLNGISSNGASQWGSTKKLSYGCTVTKSVHGLGFEPMTFLMGSQAMLFPIRSLCLVMSTALDSPNLTASVTFSTCKSLLGLAIPSAVIENV